MVVPVVALTSNLWVWAPHPVVEALVDLVEVDLVEVDLVANSKDMEDITVVVVDLMDRAVVVDYGKREWFIMG